MRERVELRFAAASFKNSDGRWTPTRKYSRGPVYLAGVQYSTGGGSRQCIARTVIYSTCIHSGVQYVKYWAGALASGPLHYSAALQYWCAPARQPGRRSKSQEPRAKSLARAAAAGRAAMRKRYALSRTSIAVYVLSF